MDVVAHLAQHALPDDGVTAMLYEASKEDRHNVTLRLYKDARGPYGLVYPPDDHPNMADDEKRSTLLEGFSALRHAMALADRFQCDITVVDPDQCWTPAWGRMGGGSRGG